jgi:23S rRNA pseudouridine1911/1915/1917 synthase
LLEDLFRSHRVERVYLALLSAMPNPPAGRIESAVDVGDDGIVRSVAAGHGTRAVTEYRAVARRGGCTLVECRLETGRRNQIRVHMAELGCPIAGDRKYGFRGWAGQRWRRPMLHAWRIGLLHPITGDRLELESTPEERELRR